MASSFWVCPNGLWCDISCMCFMSSKVLLEMLYVKFASNELLFGVKAHWGLNKGSLRAHWVLSVFMYNVLQKMLSKCVSEWTFSALPKSEGFVPGRSPGPKYRQQVAREQVARQRTRPRPTSPRGAPGAFGPFAFGKRPTSSPQAHPA